MNGASQQNSSVNTLYGSKVIHVEWRGIFVLLIVPGPQNHPKNRWKIISEYWTTGNTTRAVHVIEGPRRVGGPRQGRCTDSRGDAKHGGSGSRFIRRGMHYRGKSATQNPPSTTSRENLSLGVDTKRRSKFFVQTFWKEEECKWTFNVTKLWRSSL